MNAIPSLQKFLEAACLAGGALCLASVLAYSCRNRLLNLHRRWQSLPPFGRAFSILSLSVWVLYGGTKPPPSSTNEPPGTVSGDTTTTNDPPAVVEGDSTNDPPAIVESDAPTNTPPDVIEGDAPTNAPPDTAEGDAPTNAPPPVLMAGRPRPTMTMPPPARQLEAVAQWTARGAWIDWRQIVFPEGFSFPVGTNMLFGVTLMSCGEIRERLADATPLASLPSPVSLEPRASSCACGLTASNSFLIAWSNACVERDPTNRVDASIELFDSGDMAVRFGDAVTNIVARPPEGFVGEAQDADWLAAAFPDDYASITTNGYAAWLDGHIGHNEPNGLYKCTVTVSALPEHGPCYLVCGPYKVVVNEPGEYSFPLTDFEEYDLYTCPTEVPLTWTEDDGWEFPEPDSAPLLTSPGPRRLLGGSGNGRHRYKIQRFPEVFVHPNYLSRSEALSETITVSCNASGIAVRNYTSLSGRAHLIFISHNQAQIEEAEAQDAIYFSYEYKGLSACGTITIYEHHYCPYWPYCPYGEDCDYYHGEHSNSTNGTSNASAP